MLNTAAAERALRRIERDINRLFETNPEHVERIRAMLPALADPVVPELADDTTGEPAPDPVELEPADVDEAPADDAGDAGAPQPPAKPRKPRASRAKAAPTATTTD